jgi:hypothetical protein
MSNDGQNIDSSTYLDEEVPADKIVLFALEEAQQKLEQNGEFEPFTVILHGEDLYIESHPGDDAVQCFNSAKQTVTEMAVLADAYVFAYDGYVELDDGESDALIVERGTKDAGAAEAFALIYSVDESNEGSLEFDEAIYNLGPALSLLSGEDFVPEQLEELE